MPGPCFPMPFGGIGVCGGDLVGGAFAAPVWEEGVGVVVETRRRFGMEYGYGTGSAAQECSARAGAEGREASAGHLQMAAVKDSWRLQGAICF